jgi:nitrogen fixation protein NifU and related proteins
MSADLRELYQEVILDHYKRPRNFGVLEDANRKAEGHNPLCGDRIRVFVKVSDGVIRDVAFDGAGCAISRAAASLMTDSVKGKTVAEADRMFERFHDMVTAPPDSALEGDRFGKLAVFAGVREFPARVKCASLAWHTLQAALHDDGRTVSTEEGLDGVLAGQAPPAVTEADIIEVLSRIYDPEIPVNIYDLGLVYGIEPRSDGAVVIRMTLTSPGCPEAQALPAEVRSRVEALPGVKNVAVQVVWDPPWSPDRMSEAARLELGLL